MKIKVFDLIILNKDKEDLASRGIKKDCSGVVVKKENDKFLVMFHNSHNYGNHIFAWVEEDCLDYLGVFPDGYQAELKAFVDDSKIDFEKCFTPCLVKENDIIEITEEVPEYIAEGLYPGVTGVVISSYAINGRWDVIFDNAGEDRNKFVQKVVAEKHFKVIGSLDD